MKGRSNLPALFFLAFGHAAVVCAKSLLLESTAREEDEEGGGKCREPPATTVVGGAGRRPLCEGARFVGLPWYTYTGASSCTLELINWTRPRHTSFESIAS